MSKATDPTTPSKSWRDVINVHPAADLLPMMTPDELKALSEDIRANALAHQLVFWTADRDYWKWSKSDRIRKLKSGELYLLDGRSRLAAIVSLDRISLDCIGFDTDGWPDIIWPCASDAEDPIIFGPEVDPYRYVLSANLYRRHLTAEQRRELIAKLLKAQPEKSNRTIAKQTKADDKTVGSVRRELEGRAEIPRVSTVEDTKGRQQPTHKKAKQQAKRVDEHVQNAAHAVELVEPKQSDIEHVLPDADRLVLEILERDQIAPGYAKAVMAGIAARLEASGYPGMPDART